MPGRSSTVPAEANPNRLRKYTQVSWYVTTRAPCEGASAACHRAEGRVQASEELAALRLELGRCSGASRTSASRIVAVTVEAFAGSSV